MLGVWDYEQGTCDPASDLRLEVQPRTLGFYESVGTVTDIAPRDTRNVVVSLDMEGEGETWQERLRLTLDDDDSGLTVFHADNKATDDAIRLTRCPG